MAASLTLVGVWSAFVFAMAAFAQLVVGHLEDKHSTRTIFALDHGNTGCAVRRHDQYVRRPGLDHFARLHAGRVRANSDQ